VNSPTTLPCPALLIALCCTASTQAQSTRFEFSEVHMGMPVRIVLYAAQDSTARSAGRAAFLRIGQLDRDLSDYRENSELRRIERVAGDWTIVRPTTFAVLARARELAQLSQGAFDPTIGPLTRLWRSARRAGVLPAKEAIDSARALVSWQRLELDSAGRRVRLARRGMKLDLGGIAKGFILDEALGVLRGYNTPALIEAGGDIIAGAPPPSGSWRIEVANADPAFVRQAAALHDAALATSGPAAQHVTVAGRRYSHVLDPRTGAALTNGVTAYVIARSAATADALATALTVAPPERRAALVRLVPGVLSWTVTAPVR
jgi:thiamine biosynthesis lipoprotein